MVRPAQDKSFESCPDRVSASARGGLGKLIRALVEGSRSTACRGSLPDAGKGSTSPRDAGRCVLGRGRAQHGAPLGLTGVLAAWGQSCPRETKVWDQLPHTQGSSSASLVV